MRPSWTATTVAFGDVTRSSSRGACAGGLAAAAAADGAGGAEPLAPPACAAPAPGTAVASAVALDGDTRRAIESHATRSLRTGRRPSIRPVSVAMTWFG